MSLEGLWTSICRRGKTATLAATVSALLVFGPTASSLGQSTTASLRIQDMEMSDKLSRPRSADAVVDTVILHFSSDVIDHPEAPYDPKRVRDVFEKFGVSAHYLIDRDGAVYRLVPEERASFHAGTGKLPHNPERPGGMNNYSIGIEILAVGSAKDMAIYNDFDYGKFAREHPDLIGYTDAQYQALNALLDDVIKRRPAIRRDRKHILGHEEVDPRRKTDPGELFDWSRIGLTKKP